MRKFFWLLMLCVTTATALTSCKTSSAASEKYGVYYPSWVDGVDDATNVVFERKGIVLEKKGEPIIIAPNNLRKDGNAKVIWLLFQK